METPPRFTIRSFVATDLEAIYQFLDVELNNSVYRHKD